MYLYDQQTIDETGMLHIGGVSAKTLVDTYGTPLYVMDENAMVTRMRAFKHYFSHPKLQTRVLYASKAFLTIAMCKLVAKEGLHLDVVSGGELMTAIKAGFPMENIYFHGNNKSPGEIDLALDHGVGTFIADNPLEIDRIEARAQSPVRVMLRLNPGIEAHTHEYIATTKNDSKFGLSVYQPSTYELIKRIENSEHLIFAGVHSHIGSQIFEDESFKAHARAVIEVIATLHQDYDIITPAINLGGGFGVRYTSEDTPVELSFLPALLTTIKAMLTRHNLPSPTLMIEPGRAITANAGITLYTVGAIKTTHSTKRYCFVDGSMADHLRTALYQAKYEGAIANRMHAAHDTSYAVGGKACESGDIIITETQLPTPQTGDILAVFSTGAYHHSMASNYNRLPRPAVVLTKDGTHRTIVRRETYEDLLRMDVEA